MTVSNELEGLIRNLLTTGMEFPSLSSRVGIDAMAKEMSLQSIQR
jgi:hypothetical protein